MSRFDEVSPGTLADGRRRFPSAARWRALPADGSSPQPSLRPSDAEPELPEAVVEALARALAEALVAEFRRDSGIVE